MSFLKIVSSSRQLAYLRPDFVKGVTYRVGPSTLELLLSGGQMTYFGGQKDGEEVEDGQVKANSRIRISLGTINPNKYHVEILPSSKLREVALLHSSIDRAIPEMGPYQVDILLTAVKGFDINEYLTDVVALYLVE